MHPTSRNKSNHFTRGGQVTFHAITMFFQINSKLIKYIGWGVLALTLLLTYLNAPPHAFWGEFYYLRNVAYAKFGKPLDSDVTTIWQGQRYTDTLASQLQNSVLLDIHATLWHHIQIAFLIAFITGLLIFLCTLRFFNRQGEKHSEDCHIRGFRLANPETITKALKQRAKERKKRGDGDGSISSFTIDGHALLKQSFEVQHLLIDGTTGAGKSVMIRKLIRWIRERGDKAIIYDKGCVFTSKFYNPDTDVILNPFDQRCANWDVWCDAKDAPDFENMAAALIPQHGEGDPFWVDSARTIFSSTAYRMSQDTNQPCTTERLLSLILTSELDTLGTFLQGTESASLVSKDIKKTAISIKSVLATYIKSLRFLDGLNHPQRPEHLHKRFSITDWIHDDEQRGFLFLSSHARQHASLRPLISMWLAIASNAILGLKEDEDRRIWVIMDEMPSLHKLPELGAIIAEVRKYGGCYLIGIQSYAQLIKTYGKNAAEEMFDLLNTRFYFRAPSEQMARISAKDLGEQEVDISKENVSYGANPLRDGVSLGHQTLTRPVVSASEIQALDDLQCYMRTPGVDFITRLDLEFDKMRDVCPSFDKRSMVLSATMTKLYEQAIYHECVLPGLYLSEAERRRLTDAQEANFEDKAQMSEETKQIRKAIKSDTVSTLIQQEQQQKQQQTYQEDAQRNIEKSAISQEQEIGETYD
ncbi:type IV conjugative transfer system coupling protein TraD [Vibrio brasiliensis]|uniref:type IV conjugative transfer system coupling protein TraD n=1 Tax=Vibrio brasiliensis TaxID=170652 RepID=UPI001EFDEF22|nr:type IV conjugative transfer system coupling protein TraD [Vibrio brasiliensis]MCG9727497.1 type IV conjugative transfer system coupling protein TraD [Vibrio brasiliensis]